MWYGYFQLHSPTIYEEAQGNLNKSRTKSWTLFSEKKKINKIACLRGTTVYRWYWICKDSSTQDTCKHQKLTFRSFNGIHEWIIKNFCGQLLVQITLNGNYFFTTYVKCVRCLAIKHIKCNKRVLKNSRCDPHLQGRSFRLVLNKY